MNNKPDYLPSQESKSNLDTNNKKNFASDPVSHTTKSIKPLSLHINELLLDTDAISKGSAHKSLYHLTRMWFAIQHRDYANFFGIDTKGATKLDFSLIPEEILKVIPSELLTDYFYLGNLWFSGAIWVKHLKSFFSSALTLSKWNHKLTKKSVCTINSCGFLDDPIVYGNSHWRKIIIILFKQIYGEEIFGGREKPRLVIANFDISSISASLRNVVTKRFPRQYSSYTGLTRQLKLFFDRYNTPFFVQNKNYERPNYIFELSTSFQDIEDSITLNKLFSDQNIDLKNLNEPLDIINEWYKVKQTSLHSKFGKIRHQSKLKNAIQLSSFPIWSFDDLEKTERFLKWRLHRKLHQDWYPETIHDLLMETGNGPLNPFLLSMIENANFGLSMNSIMKSNVFPEPSSRAESRYYVKWSDAWSYPRTVPREYKGSQTIAIHDGILYNNNEFNNNIPIRFLFKNIDSIVSGSSWIDDALEYFKRINSKGDPFITVEISTYSDYSLNFFDYSKNNSQLLKERFPSINGKIVITLPSRSVKSTSHLNEILIGLYKEKFNKRRIRDSKKNSNKCLASSIARSINEFYRNSKEENTPVIVDEIEIKKVLDILQLDTNTFYSLRKRKFIDYLLAYHLWYLLSNYS